MTGFYIKFILGFLEACLQKHKQNCGGIRHIENVPGLLMSKIIILSHRMAASMVITVIDLLSLLAGVW